VSGSHLCLFGVAVFILCQATKPTICIDDYILPLEMNLALEL
jgi:hypothetical protein